MLNFTKKQQLFSVKVLLFVHAAEFYFPSGPGLGGFRVMPIDKGQVVRFWELSVTCSEMGCG